MNRFLTKNKWLVLAIAAFVLVGLKFVVDRDPETLAPTSAQSDLVSHDSAAPEATNDAVVPGAEEDESASSPPSDAADESFVDDDSLVDSTDGFDPSPDEDSSGDEGLTDPPPPSDPRPPSDPAPSPDHNGDE
jgi:hypothetical protein